ncbi:MAG: GAF domain-containing protein, partial [Steroidobacteraceae bacterium]
VGVIFVVRRESRRFSDEQIALVETFAAQAVIAIENVRLFNETKEALEQQTAISEILQVISSSPTDVRPVLSAVAERAARLCEAEFVTVFMAEDGVLRAAGYSSAAASHPFPDGKDVVRIDRGYISGRAAVTGQTVHLEDVVPLLDSEFTGARENQEKFGFRTFLAVPLLRNKQPIGVIAASRRVVRRFSDKQVALLETFADQAVIAIENVRLFNEIKEALERQTAAADILRVISSSPSDVRPVFEAIVRSGIRLFERAGVTVTRPENGEVRLMAIAERDPERARKWAERFPFPLTREYMHGVAILDCRMVDMPDVELMDDSFAAGKRNFAASGYRAMTVVPMVKDGAAIGTIAVVRDAPGPLTDKQIALLETFAAQAAIAIENVR